MSTQTMPRVDEVSPERVHAWIEHDDAVLIDVREGAEFVTESIPGSHHHPLSVFDPELIRERFGDTRIVFHCRSGARSLDAARRFMSAGSVDAYSLAGGIEAWRAEGLTTRRSAGAPRMDIMRQVQIVAGLLVAIGVLLAITVHIWFAAIPLFVGCGLVFAGATGWCGMAKLLGAMPWNSPGAGRPAPSSTPTVRTGGVS